MATQIKVPEMGESVVEATVARWMKQEGDPVKAGEAIVELETDKVNLEIAAEVDGVLSKIDHPAGDDVKIGDVLAVIETAGGNGQRAGSKEQGGRGQGGKEQGGKEQGGKEQRAEGDGQRVAQEAAPAPPPAMKSDADDGAGERATPVAKRMAAEEGVNLAAIASSMPSGRVTKQDVENFLRERTADAGRLTDDRQQTTDEGAPSIVRRPPSEGAVRPVTDEGAPSVAARPSADPRGETRQRMSRRRRTIAERLVQAQQTAAMLTTFNEVDMGAVMDLRKRRNEQYEKRHGIRLGFMSFSVKASIGALKAFPQLNAEIQDNEIVLKHYYDIGIAVGAEEGLVVPVLRNADRISFAEIEKAIKEMAEKARAGTLSIEDLRGGTFTITNGGVFGSLLSTPILNPPQVGILGLHKIEERPIALNGQVVIRPMMYVALTYDHRIVDGREAVQFLVKVKELIEDPEALLLEG
jgi:2-oxoglutarate dehydrogenase E2 component (dihydrolipoamide succinyltransferase)